MNEPEGSARERIVHVVGAGMAGLGAAVHATIRGQRVQLWEAAGHAGGRCRSFHDTTLDRSIDNGNHLILGGNRGVIHYLNDINALPAVTALSPTVFPFIELPDRRRWSIQPSRGPIPFWIFSKDARVPETGLSDYFAIRRLAKAGPLATVADCVDPSRPMFERFWQPLSRAVLNTDATEAAASPLWFMLRETLLKGAGASQPYLAANGLSTALVDPALAVLDQRGSVVEMNQRLRGLTLSGNSVASMTMGDEEILVSEQDSVILAVPPSEVGNLLPDVTVPQETRPIVNLHIRMDAIPRFPDGTKILGLIGTTAQWLFKRGDILSVTISDAGAIVDRSAEEIIRIVWAEISAALEISGDAPPARVIKEQRATIAQTPAQMSRRPSAETSWNNLFLAGDWTDTGLPATIDGALRSGYRAAELAMERNY